MHFYPFHIGDYQNDTAHLDLMEDLAYRRLLDLYYKTEAPLSLDEEYLSKLIRMRSHSDCIAFVLREYFERTDDGWKNDKADHVLAKIYAKSEAAKKSAEARWAKKGKKEVKKDKENQQPNANALRTECESDANGMLPNTQYPIPNTHSKSICTAPPSADAVLYVPTNKYGTEGETYAVEQQDVDQWQQIYPGVDVIQELRKVVGWSDSNPSKRKTKGGMKRFINGWLSRAQDNGGGKAGGKMEDVLGLNSTNW